MTTRWQTQEQTSFLCFSTLYIALSSRQDPRSFFDHKFEFYIIISYKVCYVDKRIETKKYIENRRISLAGSWSAGRYGSVPPLVVCTLRALLQYYIYPVIIPTLIKNRFVEKAKPCAQAN